LLIRSSIKAPKHVCAKIIRFNLCFDLIGGIVVLAKWLFPMSAVKSNSPFLIAEGTPLSRRRMTTTTLRPSLANKPSPLAG